MEKMKRAQSSLCARSAKGATVNQTPQEQALAARWKGFVPAEKPVDVVQPEPTEAPTEAPAQS